MSPIANLSNIVRMPRLGKIHLGIMVEREGKPPYPKPTEYFVCPEEVQAEYGTEPKELEIMFPTEDPEQFAQQWLRCYSLSQGLVCIGDGETCRRRVDTATGDIAGRNTETWEWKGELSCNPEECPHYGRQCGRVMCLQFLLPDVPGLGVWQIDSGSFYSIININSMIKMLKAILGRCSMIPLTLALGPVEVTPPGKKKKTVYIMYIKKNLRLSDLAKMAQLPAAQVLIPPPEEPSDDRMPPELLKEIEEEQVREKEYLDRVTEELEPATTPSPATVTATTAAPAHETREAKAMADPSTIKSFTALYKACFHDFGGMQPKEVLKELGYAREMDVIETMEDAYRVIKKLKEAPGGSNDK